MRRPSRHAIVILGLNRLSIRNQLVILLVGVLVPLLGLLVWYFITMRQDAYRDAYTKVRILAQSTASNLEDILNDNQAVLARLAQRPRVRALDPKACDPILDLYVAARPEFSTLAVRDAEANIVCSLLSDPPSTEIVRKADWYKRVVMSGQFSVGDAANRPSPNAWVFVTAHPIRGRRNEVSGFILFSSDLFKLNRHLFQSVPKNAVVEVVDRNGRFLLRSAQPEDWIGIPAPNAIPEGALRKLEGEFSLEDVDGTRRLYSFVTVPNAGWRVFAGLPEDEVLAESRALLARSLAVGLVVLLAIGALLYTTSSGLARSIRGLAAIADRIASGEMQARSPIEGPPEIQFVARQLNGMLDRLERANDRIVRAERWALNYAERLKSMSRRMVEVQENEQRRLARELHDRISSNLAVVGLDLHAVESELCSECAERASWRLSDCRALVESTMQDARSISADLHSAMLDHGGLGPALEDLCSKFATRTGLSVHFSAADGVPRATEEVETALYRIAQEALTNCAKHAQAEHIVVDLARVDGMIALTVADDGNGYDAAAVDEADTREGLGLLSMRERAEAFGGEFRVESSPGKGTRIIARAPVAGQTAQAA